VAAVKSYCFAILGPMGLMDTKSNGIDYLSFDLQLMSWFFIIFGIVCFIPLYVFDIKAYYGKFSLAGQSKQGLEKLDLALNGRIGFAVQEFFALFSFCYVLFHYPIQIQWDNKWLAARQLLGTCMFLSHYIHRSLIYTLIRAHSVNETKVSIVLLASFFCSSNGYLNAKGLWIYVNAMEDITNFQSLMMLVGLVLFIGGFYVNYTSDDILINLRKKNKENTSVRYFIPYGGLYSVVSTPNYFGEFIEWIGYWLFTQHRFSFLFVILTFTNLFPRALQTHNWYLEKFGNDYKRLNRKAFIPYII